MRIIEMTVWELVLEKEVNSESDKVPLSATYDR